MQKLIAVARTGAGVLAACSMVAIGAALPLTGAAVAVLTRREHHPER